MAIDGSGWPYYKYISENNRSASCTNEACERWSKTIRSKVYVVKKEGDVMSVRVKKAPNCPGKWELRQV